MGGGQAAQAGVSSEAASPPGGKLPRVQDKPVHRHKKWDFIVFRFVMLEMRSPLFVPQSCVFWFI